MKIHPYQIDINHIECDISELTEALKTLDKNLSQVPKVTLQIDSKVVFIYHEKHGGYKKPSFNNLQYEQIGYFSSDEYSKPKPQRTFIKLKETIEKMLR